MLCDEYKKGTRVVFTGKKLSKSDEKDQFYPPIGTHGVIACDDRSNVPGIVWDGFIPCIQCDFGEMGIGAYYSDYNWEIVEPSDKILIMRDKKDPMRVIARDLGTNKTAEARCNLQDTFKFETGARLALDRLFGTEATEKKEPPAKFKVGDVVIANDKARGVYLVKAPGWNGRFTPVETVGSRWWTVGKIYAVEDGLVRDNDGDVRFTTEYVPIRDFADLQSRVPFKILEIKD